MKRPLHVTITDQSGRSARYVVRGTNRSDSRGLEYSLSIPGSDLISRTCPVRPDPRISSTLRTSGETITYHD